jgi:hypothetical protein
MKIRLLAVGAGAVLALAGLQSPALAESPHYVDDPLTVDCSVGSSNKYWFKWTENEVNTEVETEEVPDPPVRVNNGNAKKEVWRVNTWSVTTTTTTDIDITYHDKVCNAGHRAVIDEKLNSQSTDVTKVLLSSVITNPGNSK